MNLFEKVEFRPHSFDALYSFTSNYVYSNLYLKNDNSGNRLYFYYKCILDGVIDSNATSASIYRPTAGSNYFSASAYLKPGTKKIQLRVYEENPDTTPDAEYVESDEIDISDKLTTVFKAPKILSEFYVNQDGPAVLNLRDRNFLEYFEATAVKLYDYETNTIVYDGPITLDDGRRYLINVVHPDKQLTTLVAEYTLKDLQTSEESKSSGVVAMYPRFIPVDGVYSQLADGFPLRTHNGNKVTKYPLFSTTDQNIRGDLYFDKTAVPVRNFEETKPGTAFSSNLRSAYGDTRYFNERTKEELNTRADFSIGNDDKTIRSSEVNMAINDMNILQNDGVIKPGDKITPTFRFEDAEGNEQTLTKPALTATECVLNNKKLNDLKFESMPPIDLNKPFYEIKTFKSDDDFVIFGSFRGNTDPLQVTTNSVKVEFDVSRGFSNDLYISLEGAAVWYPDIDVIDYLTDPNIGESWIRPLVTTNEETIKIVSDKAPAIGKSLTISAEIENIVEINFGTQSYVWKKNGVVIPNKVSRFITFDSLSPSDNGKYTVEYAVTPRGIQADDSAIKIVSEEFTINAAAENPISMVVKAEPTELVIDEELKVFGTITIKTNTIKSTILTKDGVEVKSFDTTDLAPEYVVATAAATDAGLYQFKVVYMDGAVERAFISDAINVTYDGKPAIDFTVAITVPAVDEGRQVTLVGKVNITTPPAGISYIYQWHKGSEGAIVGENDKDLVIDSATAQDAGEYWLSVLATAPDHASTLKASPHKNLVVRTDAQLTFNIVAGSSIVADGKPAKLSMSFTANQQVTPTFDWYANGVIIPDSKDKQSIEHISYGDTIYYVLGKATDQNVIQTTSQSNIVVVKGVIAVENLVLAVDGPTSANQGERVLFESIISNSDSHEGNGLNRDDYSYEWFKDGTKIGSGKELRIYAAPDAGGTYNYKIYSKVDPSISKTSPNHVFTVKTEETPVSVTLPKAKNINVGDTLSITSTVTPLIGTESFQWFKNGSAISGQTSKDLVINSAAKTDSGSYTLSVKPEGAGTPTVSMPCVVVVSDKVTPPDPKPPIDLDYYVHDLNPARDHGFMWIGWWVLDELQTAVNDGFDWKKDPTNDRFKYPHVIKAISEGLDHWKDIEMQESRNGYILSAKSFII